MQLNKIQETAIIGMILGDGYLQKTGKKNARLRLEHTVRQKEYLVWKASLLPQLFQGRPTFLTRIHPRTKRSYHYVRHQSNSSPVLGKLQKIFYPHGKKIIPSDLKKFLKSDIAFAIWYYDDGYYYSRDRCVYIYLGRVERNDADTARNAINAVFGIETKILDKKKKGFVLYISPKNTEPVAAILRKYPVASMAYKIPS